MKTRIFLIRHAETAWSKSGQHTGLTDIPLSSEGILQAKSLRASLEKISFSKVWVSPLQRAVETCQLAGLGNLAEINRDLVECDYGAYEGLTHEEIMRKDPTWTIFDCGSPGGESLEQIETRTHRVISLIEQHSGDLALFSSGHFLRFLAVIWLGLTPQKAKHLMLSPASISILAFERETRALSLWNRCL